MKDQQYMLDALHDHNLSTHDLVESLLRAAIFVRVWA